MTISRILLGTSRSPIPSLSASLLCFGVAHFTPRLAVGGFHLGALAASLLICVGCGVGPLQRRWLRRLRRWTFYRLFPLILAALVAWISERMFLVGDCPSITTTLLNQVLPLSLALASGAQCAVAMWLDFLRYTMTDRRASLGVVIRHRELLRKKIAQGAVLGRKA